MKVTIISNAFASNLSDSFATFIEADGKKILFDTGNQDLTIKNHLKMKISLTDLDFVVLSHGHLDHTGGLKYLIDIRKETLYEKRQYKTPILLAHPSAFLQKKFEMKPIYSINIGVDIALDELSKYFKIKPSKEPFHITEKLTFLGEIKRTNDFEAKKPLGVIVGADGSTQPDYLYDDSALAYKTSKGLVIITGCSHSGICNIIEQAKNVCKDERILDIIGGLHLVNPSNDVLNNTLEYLKKTKPTKMHACHCTDEESKAALSKITLLETVFEGLTLEY